MYLHLSHSFLAGIHHFYVSGIFIAVSIVFKKGLLQSWHVNNVRVRLGNSTICVLCKFSYLRLKPIRYHSHRLCLQWAQSKARWIGNNWLWRNKSVCQMIGGLEMKIKLQPNTFLSIIIWFSRRPQGTWIWLVICGFGKITKGQKKDVKFHSVFLSLLCC